MRYEQRRRIKRLYWWAAASNGVALASALFSYDFMVRSMTGSDEKAPAYPFLVRLWAGHAALWGLTFVRVARDPESNISLVRYSFTEKALTSTFVLQAVAAGKAPKRLLPFIVATDVAWIYPFCRTWLELVADTKADRPPPTFVEVVRGLTDRVYPGLTSSPGDSGPGDPPLSGF